MYFGRNLSLGGIGRAVGAGTLASIIYNMDTFNVDLSGLRTVDNAGNIGASADGDMYGSNFIELGVGQSVPLDIAHTLGTEEVNDGTFDTACGVNWVCGTSWTTGTGVASYDAINNISVLGQVAVSMSNYSLIEFEVSNIATSSRFIFFDSSIAIVIKSYDTIINGKYSFVYNGDISGLALVAYNDFGGSARGSFDINNLTIKQITNPNSYLTTFDYTNKQHQTVDNSLNTPSTTYSQTNDFNMGFSHTSNLSQAEHAEIKANPNLINNVWFDGYVLTDGFAKAGMVNFYPAGEGDVVVGGQYIQDISVDFGAEETTSPNIEVTTDWLTTGNWTTAVGLATLTNATATSNYLYQANLRPLILYVFEIHAQNITGGDLVLLASAGNIDDTNYVATIQNGITKVLIRVKDTNLNTYIGCSAIGVSGEVTKVSNREATAKEIINYTASCRTALANQNYGATNHLVKQDATGRATALADDYLIEHNGDGRYVDLGNIGADKTDSYTIELVCEVQETEYIGVMQSGQRMALSVNNTFVYHYAGDGNSYKAHGLNIGDFVHIIGTWDGTTVKVYSNSIVGTISTPLNANCTYSFTIGYGNGFVKSGYSTSNIGLFKVHKNKVYTQSEVDTAYAQAKLKYPTLP